MRSEARIRSTGTQADQHAGQNVAALRKREDWSYQELSWRIREMTGGNETISAAVLRVIEKGHSKEPWGWETKTRRMAVGEAVLLARVFGVTLDTLILGDVSEDDAGAGRPADQAGRPAQQRREADRSGPLGYRGAG